MTDDVDVSRRYRELEAQEPPRALDEAILAAATRSARSLHGSARPWTQRWAVPLSLAAVVVLSLTVTLRIQQEQPGIEVPAPLAKESGPASPAAVADAQPKPKEEAQPSAAAGRADRGQQQKSIARKEPAPFPPAIQDKVAADKPSSAAPAPASAETPASRREAAGGAESSVAGTLARPESAQMQAQRAKAASADAPERELERIAELRRQERHDEADKALAEFRKRYPDFRIPQAMRERVERR